MNKNAISPDSEDDEEFYKNSEKPTMTEVEEIVAELEAAQPSTWMVMKDVRRKLQYAVGNGID